MPRTALSVITPKGPFPTSVAANDLDFVLTACDVANGNSFVPKGRGTIIVVQNADAGPQTFTLTTASDPFNRNNNITAFSLGASEFAVFYFGNGTGWIQSDATIWFNGANANIKVAAFEIPA